MYWTVKTLWEHCVMRSEDNNCITWPDCEDCLLVSLRLVKLPKCWNRTAMDYTDNSDMDQLSRLILAHITGRCGYDCIFCECEGIPI